jgi:hypothetical protein
MTATEFLEDLEYIVISNYAANVFDIYRYADSWLGFTIEQLEGFARARGWEE